MAAKFKYIDSFSDGAFHEVFNSSSLKMFANIYPHVEYYAGKKSMSCVEHILGGSLPGNVSYHRLFHTVLKGSLGNFLSYLLSTIQNIMIAIFATKGTVLFYNYNSLWGLKTINCIARRRPGIKIVQMCHGELEILRLGIKINPITTAALRWLKDENFKPADNFRFCVLGDAIKSNLKGVVADNLLDNFITFEHTYVSRPEKNCGVPETLAHDDSVKVGYVGAIEARKGLNNYLALRGLVDSCVKFFAIGRMLTDPGVLDAARIEYVPGYKNGTFLPKETMDAYINAMDIIVFLYPEHSYKLTASGAIFDAIDHAKTVFSLHNSYFDSVFARAEIGRQFDSIEDMAKAIEAYQRGDIDLSDAQYKFSPEYEAKVFGEKLQKLGLR